VLDSIFPKLVPVRNEKGQMKGLPLPAFIITKYPYFRVHPYIFLIFSRILNVKIRSSLTVLVNMKV
jgi:hypothetical protein